VQSLAAQRNLRQTIHNQGRSIEKLASGSRITKASDDAAGLAISERMNAQIRSIRQDIRNADDGISMIQTAEGGMNEISNILVRFRELGIQASSDTIGDTERSFIDKEVQQLRQEIDRIASTTEFNRRKLLNGEGDRLEIQIGQLNDPVLDRFYYNLQETDASTENLGVSEFNVSTKENAQNNLEKIDKAIELLNGNRANLGALQNRLQTTTNNLRIYDENLSAANSRIRDVDVAMETAELTKNNILSQTGVSVLGQANQSNMLALKLLG